jgi:hypothetical protein
MKTHLRLIALLFATAWIVGCGAPGTPLPPSLELPSPVGDLTATRKGNKVSLSWSAPTQTTDGQNVRANKLGPAQVCRGIAASPMTSCAQVAGEVPAAQIPLVKPGEPVKRITFTDTLNEQVEREHPTQFATYAVSMLNWRGRTAGLSNQVKVPLAPVAAPPSQVKADVTADGTRLTFNRSAAINAGSLLEHHYRVYRRTEDTPSAVLIKDCEATSASDCEPVDTTFEWEKGYYYHVTPVTIVTEKGKKIAEVEGDDSPEVKVFAHDIFPPAQPTGLQAVYSGPGQKAFIDLTWAPNTDADLAGYDVYRHENGQAPAKINSALVKTPSFRDDNAQPGHTYFYSVSAIDLRWNQSPRSEKTSESVP